VTEPIPAVEIDETAGRLRYSATRLARQLRRQDGTILTPSQSAMLATIGKLGPMTLSDLAAQEQVTPPTVSNIIAKLEAQGLVRRLRDDDDRRVCRVELSASGRRQLEAIRSRRTAWLASRLRELPPDDLARLAAALDVLDALTDVPTETGPR
jgi:DNA-binding MarR family transcriptional regulator